MPLPANGPAAMPLAQDCWVVYGGSVYNLGAYLMSNRHANAKTLIVPQCGKDITQLFNAKHTKPKSQAKYWLAFYKVGVAIAG